jgi:single-strand DNA-binding protein
MGIKADSELVPAKWSTTGCAASLRPLEGVQARPRRHARVSSQRGFSPIFRRKTMRNIAEFQILGQVVRSAQVGKATKVTLAANYQVKDGDQWVDDPHYNTVTIFNERTQKYITDHIGTGDLVHARGRMRQGSYEKNGETVYTNDLICDEFSRLSKSSGARDEG